MNLSSKQAATEAAEYFQWRHQADALMANLLSSPNRHTRRLYARRQLCCGLGRLSLERGWKIWLSIPGGFIRLDNGRLTGERHGT